MSSKNVLSNSNVLSTLKGQGIPAYISYYKPVKASSFKSSTKSDQLSHLVREVIDEEKKVDNQTQSVWANLGIPGLDHVVDKHRRVLSRCFWAIVVLACFSTCAYQIYSRIWLFLQYPVAANLVVDPKTNVKFPQITICPAETEALRKLKNEYLNHSESNKDLDSIDLPDLIGFKNYTAQQIWEMSKLPDLQLLLQETDGKDETYAINIADKRTVNGVCKVINIFDEITYFGMTTELKIVMKSEQNGKIAFWITLEMDGDQPNFNSKLPVYYGFNMGISIKLKKFKSISTPLNPCTDGPTSAKCFDFCLSEKQTKETTCKLPFMKRNHHQLCKTASDARRTYSVVQELLYNTTLATCKCQPKCLLDLYTSSREVFDFKTSNTTIVFYYSTNRVEVLEESFEYPIFSMLCDIGGNLGLYLGLSVLSLFEIFESLNQFNL